MAKMKVIITNKKTFDVVERDNIINIAVSDPYWNLTKDDNVVVQYTLVDFNVHIMGVSS